MTVRITETAGATRTLRVEGRLAGDAVAELEQVVGPDSNEVCLVLDELRSTDVAGLELLRRLHARGISLRDVPAYLAWRIAEDP